MPNELIDAHRVKFPDDERTDLELTAAYAKHFGENWIESRATKYPNFYRDYRKYRYGSESEFGKGVDRGILGLQSTVMGGIGLALDAVPGEVGFIEDWKKSALKSAADYGRKASSPRLAPTEREFKNVGSAGQLVDYTAALFGEAAPSVAESIAVGVGGALAGSAAAPGPGTAAGFVGGVIGKTAAKKVLKDAVNDKLKGLTELQVKNALAKQGSKQVIDKVDTLVKQKAKKIATTAGSTVATALNSYGLSSGEIYNQLANDPEVDPDDAFNISLTFGAVAAAPDTILPTLVLKKAGVIDRIAGIKKISPEAVDKKKFYSYALNALTAAAQTTPIEMGTEMFQETVNIAAEKYAKDQPFTLSEEEKGRIQRAGALGAAGGLMASPLAAMNMREEADKYESDPETAEPTHVETKKKLVVPEPTEALPPEVEGNLRRLALLQVQGKAIDNPNLAAEIIEAKKNISHRRRFNELVQEFRKEIVVTAKPEVKPEDLPSIDPETAEEINEIEDALLEESASGVEESGELPAVEIPLPPEVEDEEVSVPKPEVEVETAQEQPTETVDPYEEVAAESNENWENLDRTGADGKDALIEATKVAIQNRTLNWDALFRIGNRVDSYHSSRAAEELIPLYVEALGKDALEETVDGYTPLQNAIRNNQASVVKALLEAGANPDTLSDRLVPEKAIDIAREEVKWNQDRLSELNKDKEAGIEPETEGLTTDESIEYTEESLKNSKAIVEMLEAGESKPVEKEVIDAEVIEQPEFDYGDVTKSDGKKESLTDYVTAVKQTPPKSVEDLNKFANDEISSRQESIKNSVVLLEEVATKREQLVKAFNEQSPKDKGMGDYEDLAVPLQKLIDAIRILDDKIAKIQNSITLNEKRINKQKELLASENTFIDADTGTVITAYSLNEDSFAYEDSIPLAVEERSDEDFSGVKVSYKSIDTRFNGGKPAPAYYEINPEEVSTYDEATKALGKVGQEINNLPEEAKLNAQTQTKDSKGRGRGQGDVRRLTAFINKETGEVFVLGTSTLRSVRAKEDIGKTAFLVDRGKGKKGYVTEEQIKESGALIPFASMRLVSPRTRPTFYFESLQDYRNAIGDPQSRVEQAKQSQEQAFSTEYAGDIERSDPTFLREIKDSVEALNKLKNDPKFVGRIYDALQSDSSLRMSLDNKDWDSLVEFGALILANNPSEAVKYAAELEIDLDKITENDRSAILSSYWADKFTLMLKESYESENPKIEFINKIAKQGFAEKSPVYDAPSSPRLQSAESGEARADNEIPPVTLANKVINKFIREFKVWHGSPHLFENFLLEYLGTGEGAQAFGWGLYYAERKGVAKSYKKTGRGGAWIGATYKGQDIDKIPLTNVIRNFAKHYVEDIVEQLGFGNPAPNKGWNAEGRERDHKKWFGMMAILDARYQKLIRYHKSAELEAGIPAKMTADERFMATDLIEDYYDIGPEELLLSVQPDPELDYLYSEEDKSLIIALNKAGVQLSKTSETERNHIYSLVTNNTNERNTVLKGALDEALYDLREWWSDGGAEIWLDYYRPGKEASGSDEISASDYVEVKESVINGTYIIPEGIIIPEFLLPEELQEDFLNIKNGYEKIYQVMDEGRDEDSTPFVSKKVFFGLSDPFNVDPDEFHAIQRDGDYTRLDYKVPINDIVAAYKYITDPDGRDPATVSRDISSGDLTIDSILTDNPLRDLQGIPLSQAKTIGRDEAERNNLTEARGWVWADEFRWGNPTGSDSLWESFSRWNNMVVDRKSFGGDMATMTNAIPGSLLTRPEDVGLDVVSAMVLKVAKDQANSSSGLDKNKLEKEAIESSVMDSTFSFEDHIDLTELSTGQEAGTALGNYADRYHLDDVVTKYLERLGYAPKSLPSTIDDFKSHFKEFLSVAHSEHYQGHAPDDSIANIINLLEESTIPSKVEYSYNRQDFLKIGWDKRVDTSSAEKFESLFDALYWTALKHVSNVASISDVMSQIDTEGDGHLYRVDLNIENWELVKQDTLMNRDLAIDKYTEKASDKQKRNLSRMLLAFNERPESILMISSYDQAENDTRYQDKVYEPFDESKLDEMYPNRDKAKFDSLVESLSAYLPFSRESIQKVDAYRETGQYYGMALSRAINKERSGERRTEGGKEKTDFSKEFIEILDFIIDEGAKATGDPDWIITSFTTPRSKYGINNRELSITRPHDFQLTGYNIRYELEAFFTPKQASMMLDKAGFKAYKFLDGVSRNQGEGTYNYVVFDDTRISIIKRDGQVLTPTQAINERIGDHLKDINKVHKAVPERKIPNAWKIAVDAEAKENDIKITSGPVSEVLAGDWKIRHGKSNPDEKHISIRVGQESGKPTAYKKIMQHIVRNKEVPETTRELAKELAAIKNPPLVVISNGTTHDEFKVDNQSQAGAFFWNPEEGDRSSKKTIVLNEWQVSDPSAQIMVHEALHSLTSDALSNPEGDPQRRFSAKFRAIHKEAQEKFNAIGSIVKLFHPKTSASLMPDPDFFNQIDSYLVYAKEQFGVSLTGEELSEAAKFLGELQSKELTNFHAANALHSIRYAMSSADELSAGMANRHVQHLLNILQSSDETGVSEQRRSLWDTIVQALVDLFNAAKGSLLESAVVETLGYHRTELGQRIKFSPEETVDPSWQSDDKIKSQFEASLQSLAASGVDIQVLETGLNKQLGMYSDRAIQLVIPDLANPTKDNVRLLFHEAGHSLFGSFDPSLQEAYHKSIENLTDEQLRVDSVRLTKNMSTDFPLNEATQEERLVESVAKEMSDAGFDASDAVSIVKRVMDFLRRLYLRAYIEVQKALFGDEAVNPNIARQYFKLRLESFLTKNYSPDAITMMDGAPLTTDEIGQLKRNDLSNVSKLYDLKAGTVELKEIPEDSIEDVMWNSQRKIKFSEGVSEEVAIDPVPALTRQKVVEEETLLIYEDLFMMYNQSGQNIDGMELSEFINKILMPDKKSLATPEKVKELIDNGAIADATMGSLEETTARPRAAKQVYERLVRLSAGFEKSRAAAYSKKAESSQRRAIRIADKVKEFQSKYTDLTTYTQNIASVIDQALKDYRNSYKGSKPHVVTKILRALDPSYKFSNYEKDLKAARSKAIDMEDLLVAIGEMDIDFDYKNDSPEDIAKQIRDNLSGTVLDSKVQDNVAIASLIGFGKKYPEAMALLQLRTEKNRANVDRAIYLMLSDNAAGLTEARRLLTETIRKTKQGQRLYDKILSKKAQIRGILAFQDKLQKRADAQTVVQPMLEQRKEELTAFFQGEEAVEGKEGGVSQWEPLHEANVIVPPRPDISIDELNIKRLSKDKNERGSVTATIRLSPDEDFGRITRIIDAQTAWLAENDSSGEVYGLISRQRDRLMEVQASFAQDQIQQNIITRAIGDRAKKMEAIGTPQSRQLARRDRKLVSLMATYGGDSTGRKGSKWSNDLDKAYRASGAYDLQDFFERFYDPYFTFASEFSEIIEMFPGNIRAAEREVLRRGKAYLSDRTNGASDKIWPLLEKLFNTSARSNGYVDGMREGMGVKVLDEIKTGKKTIKKFFRTTIGSPMFSLMRRTKDSTEIMFKNMRQNWSWSNKSPDKVFSRDNINAAAAAGPEALAELFEGSFSDKVIAEFVEPILNRPKSAFYISGTEVDISTAQEVWAETERLEGSARVSQFAFSLAEIYSAEPEEVASGAAEVMGVFPRYYRKLKDMYDSKEQNKSKNPIPVHTMMDARVAQDFPTEWLTYSRYTEREMRQYAESLAYESAYGRDLVGVLSDFDGVIAEMETLAQEYDRITRSVMTNDSISKKDKPKRIREMANAAGGVRAMKAAKENLATAKAERARFEDIRKNKKEQIDYHAVMELISTLTGATVQGAATAITDMSTALEGPLRKFGLSSFGISGLFKNVKYTSLEAIGTMMQLLPVSWNVNSERVKRRTRLGMVDNDSLISFRERFVSNMRDEFRSEGMLGKTTEAVSRTIKTFLDAGIGKAKNKEQLYTTLKVQAPFTMFVKWQNAGVTDSLFDLFTDFVGRAGEFFDKNPEAMNNPDYQLTAKDLGMKDMLFGLIQNEKAFDYIVSTLQQHGLNPTRLGREWVLAGKKNPLNDEHYRRIAALSATEIMLENTEVTQPSLFMSNRILAMARPLIRWPFSKTADLASQLPALVDIENLNIKDPDTRKALKAYRNFVMGMALGIIPISLAWAMVRDRYDEDLLGKKGNVLDFGEADPFLVLLDRLDRVGTFGIAGNLANTIGNMDTAREFGIDNRVFFVNSALSLVRATGTWYRQGHATYATVGRPYLMALGMGGGIQNFQLMSNLLGADNFETRYTARVNVNNYLRSAGKALGLDVRKFAGGGALPTPMKPWMAEMVLSAYANDGAAFQAAYMRALQAAKAMGKEDPVKSVKSSLTMYHPLRFVFRTPPLASEYNRILAESGVGARAISEAISLFNTYAATIGINPYMGKIKKESTVKDIFTTPRAPALPRVDYRSFSVDSLSGLPF